MTVRTMTASLPMYDLPAVHMATNAWWSAIATALRGEGLDGTPDELNRQGDIHAHWRRDDLILSQSCGYPLTHAFAEHLQPLAVPVYRAEGCVGGQYSSRIVVRTDSSARQPADLAGRRAAYNSMDSMSGWLALRAVFAPLRRDGRFFIELIESGSHARSLDLVRSGAADVAAIDCVSFALAERYTPDTCQGLRTLCFSPLAPALPYVTRADLCQESVDRLRRALLTVSSEPALAATRASLLIERMVPVGRDFYSQVSEMEKELDRHGPRDTL